MPCKVVICKRCIADGTECDDTTVKWIYKIKSSACPGIPAGTGGVGFTFGFAAATVLIVGDGVVIVVSVSIGGRAKILGVKVSGGTGGGCRAPTERGGSRNPFESPGLNQPCPKVFNSVSGRLCYDCEQDCCNEVTLYDLSEIENLDPGTVCDWFTHLPVPIQQAMCSLQLGDRSHCITLLRPYFPTQIVRWICQTFGQTGVLPPIIAQCCPQPTAQNCCGG